MIRMAEWLAAWCLTNEPYAAEVQVAVFIKTSLVAPLLLWYLESGGRSTAKVGAVVWGRVDTFNLYQE